MVQRIETMEYLLGIDIGTFSTKGVLVTADGAVCASAQVEHGISMPRPGWAEQDADTIWWHDVIAVVRILKETYTFDACSVRAIGISSLAPCVLPIDKTGKPLRDAILYGIDTRAGKEIADLEKIVPREQILDFSGSVLTSQACTPKILWLKRNEPEVYEQTDCFLTGTGYVNYKLTGVRSLDYYTSVGYPLLINQQTGDWDETYADLIAPLDRFPPLSWSCEVIGRITAEAAAQTGLCEGTPVITGTADAASEAVCAGMSAPGDMMMMYGSSNFFILRQDHPVRTATFWPGRFLEPGSYAAAGGMSTFGSLMKWCAEQWLSSGDLQEHQGMHPYDIISSLAASSEPGARGLTALPYFAGERTPLHDPDAKGVIFGLALRHTKADIMRSVLEGAAFGIRHNIEQLRREGMDPHRILAIGGVIKDEFWIQLISDICGIAQHIPRQKAGASFGDACMAAVGTGLFPTLADAVKAWTASERIVEPRPGISEAYNERYALFRELYETVKPVMKKVKSN